MAFAQRNRAIKTALVKEFGNGNVRVRGGRGTAAGWVHVDIYLPRPKGHEECNNWRCEVCSKVRREAEAKVAEILKREGLWDQIGSYYTDGPICEPRKEIIIQSHFLSKEEMELKKRVTEERRNARKLYRTIKKACMDKELVKEGPGYKIYLEGTWLWVYFDEKPSRDKIEKLKAKGFRFSRSRMAWYKKKYKKNGKIKKEVSA